MEKKVRVQCTDVSRMDCVQGMPVRLGNCHAALIEKQGQLRSDWEDIFAEDSPWELVDVLTPDL